MRKQNININQQIGERMTAKTIYRTIITNEDRHIISARNTVDKDLAEELAESWANKMLGRETGYGTLSYIAVQSSLEFGDDYWETVTEFEF